MNRMLLPKELKNSSLLSFTKTMKKQWKSVDIGQNAGNRKTFKQISIRMIVNAHTLSFEKMYTSRIILFEKMQNSVIFKT